MFGSSNLYVLPHKHAQGWTSKRWPGGSSVKPPRFPPSHQSQSCSWRWGPDPVPETGRSVCYLWNPEKQARHRVLLIKDHHPSQNKTVCILKTLRVTDVKKWILLLIQSNLIRKLWRFKVYNCLYLFFAKLEQCCHGVWSRGQDEDKRSAAVTVSKSRSQIKGWHLNKLLP